LLYYRNIENIRDANFPLALSRGNGKLRKLNNDTLCYYPGSLTEICKFIEYFSISKPFIYFSCRNNNKSDESRNYSFRDFILRESYQITWLGAFSLWDDECIGIENDIEGCNLHLWQVSKILDIASKKNNVAIMDYIFGKNLPIDNKNVDYGLYQIFYVNFFKLLTPYINSTCLSNKDLEYLERDLLFRFFTNWIIAWEIQKTKYIFNENENLKQAVYSVYHTKSYWAEYQKYYKKKYIIQKIKVVIKKVVPYSLVKRYIGSKCLRSFISKIFNTNPAN